MARDVRLLPKGDADIRRNAGIIRRRVSPQSAAQWQSRLEATIARLSDDAEQWPEADEAADLGIDLRCRLAGRRPHVYRVLFTTLGDSVLVYRVVHAAQDRLTADDLDE